MSATKNSPRPLSATAQRAKALGARVPSQRDSLRAAPVEVQEKAAQAEALAAIDPRDYLGEVWDALRSAETISDEGYGAILDALKQVDIPWDEEALKDLDVMRVDIRALGLLNDAVSKYAVIDRDAYEAFRNEGALTRMEKFGRSSKLSLLYGMMLGK